MVATPENEPQQAPEGVKEVIDVPEIPPHIEKSGDMSVTPTQFTAQVSDDQGQPLVKPTPTRTIDPPTDEETLEKQAKGAPTSSATWLATFWKRMYRKARHFGWKIVGKGGSK